MKLIHMDLALTNTKYLEIKWVCIIFWQRNYQLEDLIFNVRKIENLDCQSNDTESSIIENDIEKFEIDISGHTGVGIRSCTISLILPLLKECIRD